MSINIITDISKVGVKLKRGEVKGPKHFQR